MAFAMLTSPSSLSSPSASTTKPGFSSSFLPSFPSPSSSFNSKTKQLSLVRTRRPPAIEAMGKRVVGTVKLNLEAGKATPEAPVGPALAPKGVNISAFCREYNAKTADKAGDVVPVHVNIYEDKSFNFVLKTPPASVLLLKAAGVVKGPGKITTGQLRAIAMEKLSDLNCSSIESAMIIIAGTASNIGIDIVEQQLA